MQKGKTKTTPSGTHLKDASLKVREGGQEARAPPPLQLGDVRATARVHIDGFGREKKGKKGQGERASGLAPPSPGAFAPSAAKNPAPARPSSRKRPTHVSCARLVKTEGSKYTTRSLA